MEKLTVTDTFSYEEEYFEFNSIDEMNNFIIDNYIVDDENSRWFGFKKEFMNKEQHKLYNAKSQYWEYLDDIVKGDEMLVDETMNFNEFIFSDKYDAVDSYLLTLNGDDIPIKFTVVRSIEYLPLPVRIKKIFNEHEITTINQIYEIGREELLNLKGFGRKSIHDLNMVLEYNGFEQII